MRARARSSVISPTHTANADCHSAEIAGMAEMCCGAIFRNIDERNIDAGETGNRPAASLRDSLATRPAIPIVDSRAKCLSAISITSVGSDVDQSPAVPTRDSTWTSVSVVHLCLVLSNFRRVTLPRLPNDGINGRSSEGIPLRAARRFDRRNSRIVDLPRRLCGNDIECRLNCAGTYILARKGGNVSSMCQKYVCSRTNPARRSKKKIFTRVE